MSFIQNWRKWRESKRREEAERKAKRSKAEKLTRNKIIEILLDQYGIKETDIQIKEGDSFRFIYKDFVISFWICFDCSPEFGDMFTGRIYRRPVNKDEEECLEDANEILDESRDMFLEFQKHFNDRAFMIFGEAELVINEIMRLIELPLDEVIKIQLRKTGRIDGVVRKRFGIIEKAF